MSPPICGAKARHGGPCRNVAGYKTGHLHHGRCFLHGGRTPDGRLFAAREAAALEAGTLGLPPDADPAATLGICVGRVERTVAALDRKVADLRDDQVVEGVDLHPLLRALSSETERLARLAKMALDAGVDERRVRVAEFMVDQVAGAMRAVLDAIGLTHEQELLAKAAFAVELERLAANDNTPHENGAALVVAA